MGYCSKKLTFLLAAYAMAVVIMPFFFSVDSDAAFDTNHPFATVSKYDCLGSYVYRDCNDDSDCCEYDAYNPCCNDLKCQPYGDGFKKCQFVS
ncbi:receptor-like cell wall protein [Corchorus olitorius]|uniref:Receptor-like cell wall protein n=1 Tax=Corchorus olitorius TaxID=93759 RepID=A0A1R3HSL1_9ROSI|nr:receptor-like cell wall protein [Corchorus olitorius]